MVPTSSCTVNTKYTSLGVDLNRLHLIIAVLEKHGGAKLYNQDIFINIVGGLKIDEPSVDLATALFYAIKVDTQNFEKSSKLSDGIAFRYLFNIANRDLVRKFELTDLRRSELRYFHVALQGLKFSKRRYYTHVGRVRSPDVLVIIADFLNHVGEIDWVFVSGIHGEKLVVIFRCDGYRKSAGKLASRTFGALGSAGGHKEAARAEVPLKNLDLGDKEFTSDMLRKFILRHI